MSMIIKPLSPELAPTFTTYFKNLDFNHASHWSTCFCRFYYTDCSKEEWQARTGDTNCQEALEEINKGVMKGYLAFADEQCIGWCNANDVSNLLRLQVYVKHLVEGKRVACVICYTIHPQYRGKGVARAMLKKVIDDYKEQGYNAILALPIAAETSTEMHYRGTVNMYTEQGFKEIERHGDIRVLWLELS